MRIIYASKNEINEFQEEMLKVIETTCFGMSSAEIIENKEEGHPFGAVELGAFLLFDDERIVGQAFLYKRLTEYDGQDYYIGGLGGLAVMLKYCGKGYARQLTEKTLEMAYDIGVDVACLFTGKEETIYKFYERLGFAFLNRDAYYIDSLGKEKIKDNVMVMGLNNKALAAKILNTNYKFHYGKEEGCW